MKRVLFLLVFLMFFATSTAFADAKAQGWCEGGNQTVTTGGIVSTTKVQKSFPSCTITVYAAGTTNLSTIYSDDSRTGKANPFTAASDGEWFFYANNGNYDIKLSGGGIASPFTLGSVQLFDAYDPTAAGTIPAYLSQTTINVGQFAGATLGAKLVAACTFAALAGGGWVLDARSIVGAQSIANGTDIDSACSAIPITVLFGAGSITCLGVTGGGSTAGCITPRSNHSFFGAGREATILVQANVPNNTSFNRIFDLVADQSNVQIAHLSIDGRKSSITSCSSGNVQNAGILLGGLTHGKIFDTYIHDTCGDGIENESGSSTAASSDIEIFGNYISNPQRGGITVISGKDIDIHDNYISSNVGFDLIHSEPDTSSQYVLRVNIHDNNLLCTGAGSAVIIGGYAATDNTSQIGFNHIDGNIASGCGYEVFRSPYSSINNNTALNAYPSFSSGAIAVATHDSTAIGNRIIYTTSTGQYGIVVSCEDTDVPTIGDGFNVISGNVIRNAPTEGIRMLWCNHTIIKDNAIEGIRTVGGVSNCIHLSDTAGSASAQYNLIQGNTCAGSTLNATFLVGIVEDNTATTGAGYNRIFDNIILNNTDLAYRAGVAHPTIWRITQGYTYATLPFTGAFAGGYPGLGSSVVCTDCKNSIDNSATFAAVASGSGSGAMLQWITGTSWRTVN